MFEDPKDPKPFRWYGLFLESETCLNYLETALKVGGKSEQRVLMKIINYYINSLEFSWYSIGEGTYTLNLHNNDGFTLYVSIAYY